MPYVGRLPALAHSRPVIIVAFDPTHVLCVNLEGRLEYVEHKDIEVPWHGDAEAVYWMEYGYAVDSTVATSDDLDSDPDNGSGDSR